jgi:hypothetical protein
MWKSSRPLPDVDTFPVVTRLKLDRMSLAAMASARAGPAVAAPVSKIVDNAPKARMDFVISFLLPQNTAACGIGCFGWG